MNVTTALRASLAAVIAGCASPARAAATQPAHETVHVANWSDYVDPRVLDDFSAETGIRVVYDSYDTSDALDQRLTAGKTGYDVVVSAAGLLQKEIRAGLLSKLDRTRLPNSQNLAPDVTARLARIDPGNLYALPYMWGTFGIVYDVAKTRVRLGGADPAATFASWDAVFRPDLAKRFADCGVTLLESPKDLFAIALASQKMSPEPRGEADVARAADVLTRGKDFVKRAHSPELVNGFVKGDICVAVTTSADAAQARARAAASGKDLEVGFAVPREGAPAFLDVLTILKDAPHPAAAYAFVDYMLRPDVAARNMRATGGASGVAAARSLLEPKLRDDPLVFLDPEVAKRVFVVPALDIRLEAAEGRGWTKVTPAPQDVARTPEPRLCLARSKSRTGLLAMRCKAVAKAAKAAEALTAGSAKPGMSGKPGAGKAGATKAGVAGKTVATVKAAATGKTGSAKHGGGASLPRRRR